MTVSSKSMQPKQTNSPEAQWHDCRSSDRSKTLSYHGSDGGCGGGGDGGAGVGGGEYEDEAAKPRKIPKLQWARDDLVMKTRIHAKDDFADDECIDGACDVTCINWSQAIEEQ